MDLVGGSFGDYTILTTLGDDRMLVQRAAEAGFARLAVIRSLMAADHPRRPEAAVLTADARRAAQIQHPNVRQLHELGVASQTLYAALEYLEGISLDQMMRARGRDPGLGDPRLYCAVLAQACEGLHQAHSLPDGPLIHGALRPESVFVTSGGTTKVLGLGMRAIEEAALPEASLADPERYAYSSPEQVLARPLSPSSDVFAVGILAWEALTGRRLFARPSRVEVLRAITEQSIVPPRALAPGTPAALDEAIQRALARDPAERFGSARELAVALEEGVAELGAPHSTVTIASNIERWFGAELEGQRSLALRARRELEQMMSGVDAGEDEDFDVPTRLFMDDEGDDLLARELGIARSAAEPPPPAASGPQFARPPDTLSESARDEEPAPLEEPHVPIEDSPPATETAATPRAAGSALRVALILLLASAAGAAGYYLWTQYAG